jgi:hypothetical protein
MRHHATRAIPRTQSAVAESSAVSVDLYARLERGTGIAVSAAALARICAALCLSHDEERYAHNLVAPRVQPKFDVSPSSAELSALAQALTPHPAFVLNHRWDIVGANRAYRAAQRAAGSASDGNVVRRFFTCAVERERRPDWACAADRMVAMVRMDFSTFLNDESFRALISGLCDESQDFAKRWDERHVLSSATPVRGVVRTGRGRMRRYHSIPLAMRGWEHLELTVQMPWRT